MQQSKKEVYILNIASYEAMNTRWRWNELQQIYHYKLQENFL